MKKNVGTIDAIVRFIIAVGIGVLIYREILTGAWAIILGIIASVLLITGLIGWCGFYALTGIRTCSKNA
jgi:putative effector of murein hydrolase LrgA (UPF0299 family)